MVSDLVVANKAVWAVEQQGTKPAIERSADAGKSWTPVSMPPLLIGWPSLTSADQKTAWLYAQDSLFNAQLISTQDGGASWLELQPPASSCLTHILRAVSAQFLWFICGQEPATAMQEKSVNTSSDGGASWTLQADSSSKDPASRGITNQRDTTACPLLFGGFVVRHLPPSSYYGVCPSSRHHCPNGQLCTHSPLRIL